jgi:hypothetical protein
MNHSRGREKDLRNQNREEAIMALSMLEHLHSLSFKSKQFILNHIADSNEL